MRLTHIPLRLATGAFILNAGWGKRKLDKDSAAGLQAMAARVIPPVSRTDAEKFGKMLSYAEMTLGAALLTPLLPSRLAGRSSSRSGDDMVTTSGHTWQLSAVPVPHIPYRCHSMSG